MRTPQVEEEFDHDMDTLIYGDFAMHTNKESDDTYVEGGDSRAFINEHNF